MSKLQPPTDLDIAILEEAVRTNNTAVIESYRPLAEAAGEYLSKVVEVFKKSGILDIYAQNQLKNTYTRKPKKA